MTKSISLFSVAVVLCLSPSPVVAQTGTPTAQVEEPMVAPADFSAAAPTFESLQAELRRLQAKHDAELQALREDLARRDVEAAVAQERDAVERDRKVRIYGFADVGAMRTIAPEDAQLASQFTTPLTFYLGRLNLYYDARPDPDFRFLAETRLTLYPGGTSSGVSQSGQVLHTSTLVSDVSSPNPTAQVNWGSIILERAVLDWTRYSLFSVRVGLFLTPFGIYNVDHGSPTLITVTLPPYISQGWIPERQLGIQIFGIHPIERWELGYAATIGNGRTDGILDVGDSKAFGGRFFARRQGELRLALGASVLYRPYRRNLDQFGMNANGAITFTSTRVVESSLLTVGIDQSIDYHGLRVRNELVYFQTDYTSGKRDAPAQGLGGLAPDVRQINWNLIVSYRQWDLEPYFRLDLFHTSPSTALLTDAWVPGIGLNLYLRPNVILKTQWAYAKFHKDGGSDSKVARQNFHSFNGSLVWAF